MDTKFSGLVYPAKSSRLELIDLLKEQMNAGYQPQDRASITRPILERVVADLEHAVQILDELQDQRTKLFNREKALEETVGRIMNAEIDLSTGQTKATVAGRLRDIAADLRKALSTPEQASLPTEKVKG